MIDLQALGHSFPHIVDSIILFSDDESQGNLRLTSRYLRQQVDLTLHRTLQGSTWFIEKDIGFFVRSHDNESVRRVVCRWEEKPHFPGLQDAKAVYLNDITADVGEQVARQVSPDVVPYLSHLSSPSHYPLFEASCAVLEVNLLECHCQAAEQVYDYRFDVPDVLVARWGGARADCFALRGELAWW